MIDIHCHLLPGIDDGPKTWEQSIDLCRAMAANGIRRAVATPHLIDGVYNNTLSRVRPLATELNRRTSEAGIDLEVLCGAEVDLSSRYISMASDELPILGGGRSVLLEMPMAVIPHAMAEIIFSARAQGLIPILAHPERNEILQENLGLADEWIRAGAALQLDGDSLFGDWGQHAKRCGEELLARGLFHAMASDAHSIDRRPPKLREALEVAIGLVGEDARKLVTTGPELLLAGICPETPMYPPRPLPRRRSRSVRRKSKRSLFDRILGRST
jgi:protein-tyrosine phosphatase